MVLKSLTEKILLKIMTTSSLIAKIRSKNALITKGPATKFSPTERTTANSLAIKSLTIKRPTAKKTNSEKQDCKQLLRKKSDTEESSVKILVKKSESEKAQSRKLFAKISAVINSKKINYIGLYSNSEIPNSNKSVGKRLTVKSQTT